MHVHEERFNILAILLIPFRLYLLLWRLFSILEMFSLRKVMMDQLILQILLQWNISHKYECINHMIYTQKLTYVLYAL